MLFTRSRAISDLSFLPSLRPPFWEDRDAFYCHPLCRAPEEELSVPFVAYGWARRERMTFLRRAEARALDPEAVRREALRHLAERKGRSKWRRWRLPGSDADVPALLREGDAYTATDVLLPAVLQEAQAALCCDEVAFAVPTPRIAVAVALEDAAHVDASEWLLETFEEAESDFEDIAPDVFRARDGIILGYAEIEGGPDGDGVGDGEPDDAPDEDADKDLSGPRVWALTDGSLRVPLTADDAAGLSDLALVALARITSDPAALPGFSGRVCFAVNGLTFPPTRANRTALGRLARNLEGVMEQAGARTVEGERLEVAFEIVEWP